MSEKTSEKLYLSELTSGEAKTQLTEETVIVITMGSFEDQGTHAPMGDYLGAEHVARDIVRTARTQGVSCYMAPVIPFGTHDNFGFAKGGMSISHATMVSLLDDMIDSLLRHGLRKIFIVNGHGGNVPPLNELTLRRREKDGLVIPSMYLWQISYGMLVEMFGADEAAKRSGHGADPLTSIGLHYYPELIRTDMLGKKGEDLVSMGVKMGNYETLSYEGYNFHAPVHGTEAMPEGVLFGDPVHCDAETGAKLAKRLSDLGAGFIRDHVIPGFEA